MRRWFALPIALLAVGFLMLPPSAPALAQSKPATTKPAARPSVPWVTLLDGTSLANWTQLGDANWHVADGTVMADKGNGFLMTKDSYGDFELRAEFWVDDKANSGIFIRCSDWTKVTAANSYEVNIFDTRPDPSYGTGAIVDVAKVSPMPKAGGRWNTYEIVAKGGRFTVTLNGVRTVNGAQDWRHARGPIALQYAAGVVKFKSLQIRPL